MITDRIRAERVGRWHDAAYHRIRLRSDSTGTAPLFAALGAATRLQILTRLRDGGPMSIAELSEGARMSRQAITKHLRTWVE